MRPRDLVDPEATGADLMRASRWATIGLCVAGVALAAIVPNINRIWSIITMGLGAGFFVPTFLRWYWPRLNGYGFAAGTGVGMITGIVANAALNLPLYEAFPLTIGAAAAAAVATSLLTPATPDRVLVGFWYQINPWGFWGRVAGEAQQRGLLDENEHLERTVERLNDVVSLAFAVPFQVGLLLAGMSFVFHDWTKFAFFSIVAGLSGLGLYFFWYRNLKSEERCAEEDAFFRSLGDRPEDVTSRVSEVGALISGSGQGAVAARPLPPLPGGRAAPALPQAPPPTSREAAQAAAASSVAATPDAGEAEAPAGETTSSSDDAAPPASAGEDAATAAGEPAPDDRPPAG